MAQDQTSATMSDDRTRREGRLTCMKRGFFLEAFGERGSFPNKRALFYLAWLLDHPGKPISALELARMGRPADAGHHDLACCELDNLQDTPSTDLAMDARGFREVRKRRDLLKADIIPQALKNMRRALTAGGVGPSAEFKNDVAAAEQEIKLLDEWLKKNTRPQGGSRNINGANERDSARTTTRKNLNRFYVELRSAGMNKLSEHLAQNILYVRGYWRYVPDNFGWTVEWDH